MSSAVSVHTHTALHTLYLVLWSLCSSAVKTLSHTKCNSLHWVCEQYLLQSLHYIFLSSHTHLWWLIGTKRERDFHSHFLSLSLFVSLSLSEVFVCVWKRYILFWLLRSADILLFPYLIHLRGPVIFACRSQSMFVWAVQHLIHISSLVWRFHFFLSFEKDLKPECLRNPCVSCVQFSFFHVKA